MRPVDFSALVQRERKALAKLQCDVRAWGSATNTAPTAARCRESFETWVALAAQVEAAVTT